MKKTILCLLLALGLLLLSAAAMAASDQSNYIFYIDEGNITITDGNNPGTITVLYGDNQKKDSINPKSVIIVQGYNPPNGLQLSIETEVPVKISYSVKLDGVSNVYPMSIAANADVTLELYGSPIFLFGGNDQPAITLGSGSKLTVKGAVDSREELRLYSSQSAILGPNSETPATVILDSGIVHIHSDSGSGISGNVNLVINGGQFVANGKDIDVNSLIVTGGELWAGSDSSTKVTYLYLEGNPNQNQITCEGGILPFSVDYYDELAVFGELTLPVDLTIQKKLVFIDGAELTIPTERSLTCSYGLQALDSQNIIYNYGKLTLDNKSSESNLYGKLVNDGTLCINCLLSMFEANALGTLTNTEKGTISGNGSIYPRLNQDKPTSLKIDSIVNGTVTLAEVEAGITAAEYKADDTSWGENRVFTNVDLSESRTFSARYKANNFFNASGETSITVYPVSLNANGGTIASGKDVGYYIYGEGATLPGEDDMTRQNYSFAGWYDNEALTGTPITEIANDANTAKTFWAKWTPDTYNLTLITNGGTINSGDLNSYTYGEGATLPTDVQKENYKFAGWYANEALTGDPVTAIGTTETGERKYWAKWTADDFTVTLNANGGTINSGNVTGYSFGVGATLPTDVTRTGYTFAGWYDNAALTGSPVTAIGTTETGKREYWAKWVVVLTDPDGAVVSGDTAFAKLPPVKVPTLVLPEGTTLGGSVMLKYVEVDTTRENTAIYDVYLVDQDGNRVKLPAACTLCLPYPEGLNQSSAGAYRIHILHEMDGGRSEDFDSMSGGLELTAQGLCVRVSSLSPFTITWERFPEVNLPQTGDSSHPGLWLALGLASIAALAVILLRGRKGQAQ